MKLIYLTQAIAIIICWTVFPWAGNAQSLAIRNCTWCHGSSGQGLTPVPRLAGQRLQYIENQLRNYREHRRNDQYSRLMWDAAAAVNSHTAHDLAVYFSRLHPKPANDGDKKLVAKGRKIFQDGIPESNIVACAACHGPNAEGTGEIPRLGGLSYYYVKRRLTQWGEAYHPTGKPPMPTVAKGLPPNHIDAVASYLSFVH